MSFKTETIDAFGPDYEPPNYDLWLHKACWDIKEICYLANGFNPAYISGGLVVDLNSGEIEDAPLNYGAVVLAVEVMGVVKRGIESGELKPATEGGKYFKPHSVISYLNRRGVVLPHELLAALPPGEVRVEVQSAPAPQKRVKRTSNWIMEIQAQAAIEWKKYQDMECNPTKLSIKDDLAKWCREKDIRTSSHINPSAEYIYRHVLRTWTPPGKNG